MKDENIYLIYRTYSKKMKKINNNKNYLFGWSKDKNAVKAFLMQRDENKYNVIKTNDDEIAKIYGENDLDEDLELDYVNLTFSSNGEIFPLYTTKNELGEIEISVQRYFKDLCRLDKYEISTVENIIKMLSNLKDIYEASLEMIGFRPPEMDALYPGYDDEYDVMDNISDEIFTAYSSYCVSRKHTIPGLDMLSDLSKKILYSVESFIKVNVEDM